MTASRVSVGQAAVTPGRERGFGMIRAVVSVILSILFHQAVTVVERRVPARSGMWGPMNESVARETSMDVRSFVRSLPKAELHMHLEGSLEPEMLMRLASRNRVEIPFRSVEEIRAAYRFTELQDFLDIYYQGMNVLRTEEDFHDRPVLLRRLSAGQLRRGRRGARSRPSGSDHPGAELDRGGVPGRAGRTGASGADRPCRRGRRVKRPRVPDFVRQKLWGRGRRFLYDECRRAKRRSSMRLVCGIPYARRSGCTTPAARHADSRARQAAHHP